MQTNSFTNDAEISDSDNASVRSEVPSELFFDSDVDGSFLASSSDHLHPVTDPDQSGKCSMDLSQRTSKIPYGVSDSESIDEAFLGIPNYGTNMSEANSTIVVDTSPRAPSASRMIQTRRRSSTGKKGSPTKDSTSNRKGIPQFTGDQKVELKLEDAETEMEEERQVAITRRGSSTRKRKRKAHMDEEYDAECLGSMGSHGGEQEKTGRSKPKKGRVKARAPLMGQFNVSGVSCKAGIASSSKNDAEQEAPQAKDDPWEAEPFQKEYEESMIAKIGELKQLISITEFPPPSNWYAGVPKTNSQWTVCIRPPKPTWYHPDWDAERRKQADKATAELVRKGEEILGKDMKDRRYEFKKTGRTLVTKRTVTWYQCHWFPTGKRWVFNIALDGYDQY
ncbi:hypothetical protein BKA64DRAFT_703825 [Cadophora sp. MPI-SDFR-AT-0126]|nr:hypothetical protein BKA64DRAFT_703825 [Leotiomycetes sp. MPI-SDFR-AT-0126]